ALIKDVSIVPDLVEYLHDEKRYMRWYAAKALGELGDERAVPALVERLTDTEYLEDFEHDDPEWQQSPVCEVALEALERVGTPEALKAAETWKEKFMRSLKSKRYFKSMQELYNIDGEAT